MTRSAYDAVVVGSGPNGLAAAITLAEAGRSVLVLEGAEQVGGGMRSEELTLPGFVHDPCSTVHPLAVASRFLSGLPLTRLGVELVYPPAPLAHPFDDGTAAVLWQDLEATAGTLGARDGRRWRQLFGPMLEDAEALVETFLGPPAVPRRNLLALARFGLPALLPAATTARLLFSGEKARGLFAGLAAHSIQALTRPPTSAFGLILALLGHRFGWPVVRGGSQALADGMTAYLRELGGDVVTGQWVTSLADLPSFRVTLLDVTPRQLVALAGDRLPSRYRSRLQRYRYGPGVFKIDYALDGPVPWAAAECAQAATVHLGARLDEVVASEADAVSGRHSPRPYVLAVQASLFDDRRAPEGQHTLWAYCHVPHASTVDMTGAIEAQLERFAPGFRDRVLHRSVMNSAAMQAHNPNYIGGDIGAGVQDLFQLFTRPTARWPPYATPIEGLYLCSASTPPGAGVHGMCGVGAAQAALRRELR